jgi:hypothetical protein
MRWPEQWNSETTDRGRHYAMGMRHGSSPLALASRATKKRNSCEGRSSSFRGSDPEAGVAVIDLCQGASWEGAPPEVRGGVASP